MTTLTRDIPPGHRPGWYYVKKGPGEGEFLYENGRLTVMKWDRSRQDGPLWIDELAPAPDWSELETLTRGSQRTYLRTPPADHQTDALRYFMAGQQHLLWCARCDRWWKGQHACRWTDRLTVWLRRAWRAFWTDDRDTGGF